MAIARAPGLGSGAGDTGLAAAAGSLSEQVDTQPHDEPEEAFGLRVARKRSTTCAETLLTVLAATTGAGLAAPAAMPRPARYLSTAAAIASRSALEPAGGPTSGARRGGAAGALAPGMYSGTTKASSGLRTT